jgi:hypothetical protein
MQHLHHPGALIKNKLVFLHALVYHFIQTVSGTEMVTGGPYNQDFYGFIRFQLLEYLDNFSDHPPGKGVNLCGIVEGKKGDCSVCVIENFPVWHVISPLVVACARRMFAVMCRPRSC